MHSYYNYLSVFVCRFIDVIVTDDDLNAIKRLEDLFTSQFSAYLRLTFDAIRDMADNPIIGLDATEAEPASGFMEDSTRPILDAFDLDMTAEVLTLYFRETVDYMTLNVSFITLQQDFSATGLNDSYSLTGGVVSPMDATTIMVNLTTLDVNILKTLKIGVSNFTTFLSIGEGAILDQVGQRLRPRQNGILSLEVSLYVPDMTAPELVSFALDLDGSGTLQLTFSETVDASSFNSTLVVLQNSQIRDASNPLTFFTLSTDSQNYQFDLPAQRVDLAIDDLNEIKRLQLLATSVNDTFISLSSEVIEDVFGNPLVTILPSLALQASVVTPDAIRPELLSYNLNLTSETLELLFSETVNATSLYVPAFQLVAESPANANTTSFQLTEDSVIIGGNPFGQDDTFVTITLGTNDLNAIKSLIDLAVSNSSTYLAFSSEAIADMTGNSVVATNSDDPVPVEIFTEDAIQPTLVRFDLNMNSGVLSLTFDETVNGSSFDPSGLTILATPSVSNSTDSEAFLTLSGAQNFTLDFTTIIDVLLLDDDLNEIKRQRGLAVDDSTAFLSIAEESVFDMNQNAIVPINESNAQAVTVFTNDTTAPVLLGFDLNLTSELLTLEFSETVRVSTLEIMQVTIQGLFANLPSMYWSLQSGEVLTNDSTVVVIQLNSSDLNEIKIRTDLATMANNTFISVTDRFVQDMNANWNAPVPSSMPIQVSNFTEDFTSPELIAFVFDLDGSGMLSLTFSEAVNGSSLDVTEVTLLMSPGSVSSVYTLSSASGTNSTDGTIINVNVSLDDLNTIKMIPTLAISVLTTYVSITDAAIADMNGNAVANIFTSFPQAAADFIADMTPPTLDSFELDLNSGLLTLNFSETIIGESLIKTRFTLQNASNFTGSFFVLEPVISPLLIFHYTIVVPLTDSEQNEIKRLNELATSSLDTWIAIEMGGVLDTSNNPLVPISSNDALQVSNYTNDTTRPNLINFDLDIDAGRLTLTFDETVRAGSLNVSQIALQNNATSSFTSSYNLIDSMGSFVDSTVIEVSLSFFDINQLKRIRNLASVDPGFNSQTSSGSGSGTLTVSGSIPSFGGETEQQGNTFISITADAIEDMNFNAVNEIPQGDALSVGDITLDTTQPELAAFDFNLNTEQLTLTFTETVDMQTLQLEAFTIIGSSPSENYTLTGGSTPSEDDYIIVVQLSIDDVNNIKRDLNVAVDSASTQLYLSPTAILDMNGNRLNFSEPLGVRNFTADTMSPVLVSFDLDLDLNLLLLTFNETVRVQTLDVTEITLQNSAEANFSDPTTFRVLQDGVFFNADDPVVIISLQPNDTNYIKTFIDFATSENSTFVSFSNVTIADTNGNPVTYIPPGNASQVSNFTEDTTSPFLVSYELDLTLEEIRLTFDETVNVNSFDAARIELIGVRNSSFRLTGGVIAALQNDTTITLTLTTSDLNEIKRIEALATNTTNTFLSFDQALLVDMNANYIQEITTDLPLPPVEFIPDFIDPELVSYHLDMNEGLLHLTFSETVRVATLVPQSFSLQSANDSNNISYTLMSGYSDSSNSPEITLVIPTLDLNNIKRITNLATEDNNTFLYFIVSPIQDMNGNNATEIFSLDALQAENFTEDMTSPNLVSFDLDLDADILRLTFDETVLVSSANASYISLVDSSTVSAIDSTVTLSTSGLVMDSLDDPVVSILLSRFDSNELKSLIDLATNENNTHLVLTSQAITDMNFNPVVELVEPLPVVTFTEDETSPTLEFFVVDMDERSLTLYFSETINITSFMVEELTLQDNFTADGPAQTLSPPTEVEQLDHAVVLVILSTSDGNRLTSLTNLYNSLNDSFLSFTNLTVLDTSGNSVEPLPDTEAVQAIGYAPDITDASLVDFTVDLDNGTVTLYFNETVSAETLDYTKFHLFSDEFGSVNFTLTNGSFDVLYSHVITIFLTESDICGIKIAELWTTIDNTWLYVELGAVFDWTMDNPLNEDTIQSSATPIEDLSPELLSYAVDMTRGVITLNFDEPVQPVSLVYRRILLQNAVENYTEAFRLTGGSSPSMNGKQIQVQITSNNLNAIKAHTDLFTDPSTTYLTLGNGTILDMVLNPSSPVDGFPVSVFVNDTNNPLLVAFSIDMNQGQLHLTFNETVDVSTFYLPAFTLQEDSSVDYSDPMTFHTFSNQTVAFTSDAVEMRDNRIVIVNISLYDLNEIKRKEIANRIDTTWIVIAADALFDNNQQPVIPLLNGVNTIRATNYTDDSTSPELESYNLSLNQGTLVLSFSETVRATTLDVTQITLLNSFSFATSTQVYSLATTSLYAPEQLSIDGPASMDFEASGFLSGSGSGMIVPDDNDTVEMATLSPMSMLGSGSGSGDRDMTLFLPLSSFNSPVLVLYLSHSDLDEIKALTELAINTSTSYLSVTASTIEDMVGNSLTELNTSQPLLVSTYEEDSTNPQLRGFSFDLDSGNLTLTFTETVDTSALNVTQVTLINELCTGTSFSLRAYPPHPNTSASFSEDGPIVVIQIGSEDLDAVKNLRDLASARANTLLYITEYAVADNAGNSVLSLTACDAVRAADYTHDTTRPELISFDIDLDDGRLILTFSETVKVIDSLDIAQIALQSTEMALNDNLNQYTLTTELPFQSSSMDEDSRVVMIRLGFRDLNAIKYRTQLATSVNDTYVSITSEGVVDQRNNPVISVPPTLGLQARIHKPDITSPVLVNFTLDMNTTTLILTFNETVNSASLDVSQIAFQSDVISSLDYHSSSRYLTPGLDQTHTNSDNGHVIDVTLGPLDRNEIKRRQNLAVSLDTSYLTAMPYAILDMNDNFLSPILDGFAQQAVEYVPDETPLTITNFTLDMNFGRITLTFDETVNASSLLVTGFTLQEGDGIGNDSETFRLTGGMNSQSDGIILTIDVTTDDLNEIKRLTICREVDNCFLLYDFAAVFDMMVNAIEDRQDGFGMQVSEYLPDMTSPVLTRFETNLTSETITLTFSETVNASSIDFTAFTLQDFFEGTYSYTLTDGIVQSEDSTVVEFKLVLEDLNEIKRNTDIYTARTNSWLTITEFAIQDLALIPNYVEALPNTTVLEEGIVTSIFIPDFIPPELVAFDLNLSSDVLTLYFTETILARSLNISEISLQNRMNRASGGVEWHALQMGELPVLSELPIVEDFHILTIRLGLNDTNIIKAFTNLATQFGNTFISITAQMADDMNRNSIVPIPPSEGQMVQLFTEDSLRPRLLSFELDLDTGELILTFSETINGSSLQVEDIQIQSSRDGVPTTWSLTPLPASNDSTTTLMPDAGSGMGSGLISGSGSGSARSLLLGSASGLMPENDTVTSNVTIADEDVFAPYHSFAFGPNNPILFIQLGFTDLNRIKQLTDLATSEDNTFISLTQEAFEDMNANPILPVPPLNATQASEFTEDTTPPQLIFFSLNLTSEILSLTFDETVNASSLNPADVVLQEREHTPLVSLISWYQLQAGEVVVMNDYIIDIELDLRDLNELKRLSRIATSRNNTYLTISSELVRDMNGNAVEEIINGRGLQVNEFSGDFIRPTLLEFHLDMDLGRLYLTFDETVNASSLDVTQITLQDDRTNLMNRSRVLTSSSYDIFGLDDSVIAISLSDEDLNAIKAVEMLALSVEDTWIAITEELISDTSGRPVVEIPDGNAQRAANFTPDTTRPFLLAYHFDFIVEEITLSFNEPINISTINYTTITVQDGLIADDFYTLTGGVATAFDNSLTLVIAFDEEDINFFKMHPSLTTSVNDTYLTFTSDAFYDLATVPNPVIPIINGTNATQASSFTYYDGPIFNSLTPIAGRESGGTILTIIGGNFGALPTDEGEREVDILIDFVPTINATVVVANTTVIAITPPANPAIVGQPVTLTVTIDNSALMLNISQAFTYLPPPVVRDVFPTTGTQFGGTFVTIFGENFGPTSASRSGPPVRVYFSEVECVNTTVLSDTILTCVTPVLRAGLHDVTVSVDSVEAISMDAFTALEPAIIYSITPNSIFRNTPVYVNITGENFGPTSASEDAYPLLVFFTSPTNISLCVEPTVIVEDSLISCLAEPNVGPSNITVVFDGIDSTPSNVTFNHYDNAGNFSLESSQFLISERDLFANVTVLRQGFPPYPSPVNVSVQAFDGSALTGSHFEASNQTMYMGSTENTLTFQIAITAGSYLTDVLRKGQDDDVFINLRISSVQPLHGEAGLARDTAILTIRALCQVVSHVCIADWNIDSNSVVYYRQDELP